MNKYQKVISQITKDTLKKEPVKIDIAKFGENNVFRVMRICHRIEIKENNVDFETLLEFKKFNKDFK